MSDVAISWTVFACIFAGAVLGMVLRNALPHEHLSTDSKDIVRLGTGLIATMAALVLGLLIAAAQNSFSSQRSEFSDRSPRGRLLHRHDDGVGPGQRRLPTVAVLPNGLTFEERMLYEGGTLLARRA